MPPGMQMGMRPPPSGGQPPHRPMLPDTPAAKHATPLSAPAAHPTRMEDDEDENDAVLKERGTHLN